jgi:hypothetical protein
MTNFLEVGSIREGLQEIRQNAGWLWRLLSMSPEQRVALEKARVQQGDLTTHADDVRTALSGILEQSESLLQFMDQFESAPIVYTGSGSTADVLAMLDRLMTLAAAAEQPEP